MWLSGAACELSLSLWRNQPRILSRFPRWGWSQKEIYNDALERDMNDGLTTSFLQRGAGIPQRMFKSFLA
jgi:hypothetical protein